MEKSTHHQRAWDREHEGEVEFGGGPSSGLDAGDARSISTIVPHELEIVEEEEEQVAKRDHHTRRMTSRGELGGSNLVDRGRLSLWFGMTHLSDDDEPRLFNASTQPSVIDELFQRLSTLSTRFMQRHRIQCPGSNPR